jgi:hypothetical protein
MGLEGELEAYGKKLENTGRIKEAEKLYLALDKVDLAIDMYKNIQRYDEVPARLLHNTALKSETRCASCPSLSESPFTTTYTLPTIFISFYSSPR